MFELIPPSATIGTTQEPAAINDPWTDFIRVGGQQVAIILAIAIFTLALGQFIKSLVPLLKASQRPKDDYQDHIS